MNILIFVPFVVALIAIAIMLVINTRKDAKYRLEQFRKERNELKRN